jgi:peptidoglycan hydrolase-like protein with peptidoglycan-binding domain
VRSALSARSRGEAPSIPSFAPDGRPPAPGRFGRRRRVAALAAILLAAVAGTALALSSGSPRRASAGAGVPAGDTTASVERRTLVERSQVDGTLSYASTLELYDRKSGTFTWLPAVGALIARGGTLFKVDNLPVALMYGGVPAYRALTQGVSDGPDVAQLNRNLVDLGFDPYGAIGNVDHFGEATAAAVRRWQKAEGLGQTGEVQLGRVLFAPSARRVTAVHVAVGEDPPPSNATEAGENTPPAHAAPAKKTPTKKTPSKKKSAKKPASKEPSRGKEKEPSSSEKKPAGSKQKEPSEGKEKEPAGSKANASAPVLVLGTTSTAQIVQLQVKATQQQLAHVGEMAPVTLPNGEVVQGHITNVGTVASESSENEKEKGGSPGAGNPSSGNGENATISVTLTLEHAVAHLDKAPVSVQLVKAISRDVLAVPATALIATAGGGYAIEALEAGRRVAVPVTPGMFANGYVEIEGAGVHEGLTVVLPQ